jgi:DNA repair protein RAD7
MTDEDEAARRQFEESHAPLPAQTDNCEICEKRFTVTGYSRKGEDGGLLCPKCSKELDKEEGAERKRRKTAQGRQRRQVQSNLLDGIYPGAKDLMTICIETLAKNVDIADDLGDLPDTMVDRLSSILSKRRLMNSTTLNLFLKMGKDTINIHEGATLTADDYIRVFQWTPTVKNLLVKDGIQFKNKVMDHLIDCPVKLESFSIHGSNLIDDERWDRFLKEKGSYLKALKVYYTDGHFGDEQLELLPKTCPDLQVLKVSHNQKVTDAGIARLADLTKLQKLTLQIYKPTSSEPYVKVIDSVGYNLRTLCLDAVHTIDDTVLKSIHNNCQNLNKLRITDNEVLTDSAFASLFTDWSNPPLTHIDFSKCRHIDAADPRDNPDGIGLGSLGFLALMTHSQKTLRYLDIHSCRHISLATFEEVFNPKKKYPELKKMNLSFCSNVNDYVVATIFKCCPNLETLVTFGNFGVRDVRVPKGKILIGVPTAMGMQIEGTEDGEGRVI